VIKREALNEASTTYRARDKASLTTKLRLLLTEDAQEAEAKSDLEETWPDVAVDHPVRNLITQLDVLITEFESSPALSKVARWRKEEKVQKHSWSDAEGSVTLKNDQLELL
jgi:hypothetical protein